MLAKYNSLHDSGVSVDGTFLHCLSQLSLLYTHLSIFLIQISILIFNGLGYEFVLKFLFFSPLSSVGNEMDLIF